MLLTDDRLVTVMRDFVTATNRVQNLLARDGVDLVALERAQDDHAQAGRAVQDALVERGWRRPSF